MTRLSKPLLQRRFSWLLKEEMLLTSHPFKLRSSRPSCRKHSQFPPGSRSSVDTPGVLESTRTFSLQKMHLSICQLEVLSRCALTVNTNTMFFPPSQQQQNVETSRKVPPQKKHSSWTPPHIAFQKARQCTTQGSLGWLVAKFGTPDVFQPPRYAHKKAPSGIGEKGRPVDCWFCWNLLSCFMVKPRLIIVKDSCPQSLKKVMPDFKRSTEVPRGHHLFYWNLRRLCVFKGGRFTIHPSFGRWDWVVPSWKSPSRSSLNEQHISSRAKKNNKFGSSIHLSWRERSQQKTRLSWKAYNFYVHGPNWGCLGHLPRALQARHFMVKKLWSMIVIASTPAENQHGTPKKLGI